MKTGNTARDLWNTLHMRVAMRLWSRRVWRNVERRSKRR